MLTLDQSFLSRTQLTVLLLLRIFFILVSSICKNYVTGSKETLFRVRSCIFVRWETAHYWSWFATFNGQWSKSFRWI